MIGDHQIAGREIAGSSYREVDAPGYVVIAGFSIYPRVTTAGLTLGADVVYAGFTLYPRVTVDADNSGIVF